MVENGLLERRKECVEHTKNMADLTTSVAVLATDISYIKDKVTETNSIIKNEYVTKVEFEPIKKIVYGVVGLICSAVIIALIALVVQK